MRIALVSRNRYLWQKLRLLRPDDEVILVIAQSGTALLNEIAGGGYDKLVWDADTAEGDAPAGAVTLSQGDEAMLSSPFSEQELSAALGEREAERISVMREQRTVALDGVRIKLTEVEFALFSALYEARGSFVPREELITAVWGDIGNDSLINVYIHYLREKLERGAEKIIFSSRRLGYKLDVGNKPKR